MSPGFLCSTPPRARSCSSSAVPGHSLPHFPTTQSAAVLASYLSTRSESSTLPELSDPAPEHLGSSYHRGWGHRASAQPGPQSPGPSVTLMSLVGPLGHGSGLLAPASSIMVFGFHRGIWPQCSVLLCLRPSSSWLHRRDTTVLFVPLRFGWIHPLVHW
jgi:hypothetical protein